MDMPVRLIVNCNCETSAAFLSEITLLSEFTPRRLHKKDKKMLFQQQFYSASEL